MVIVEFMDWKIEPEPTIAVFFLARNDINGLDYRSGATVISIQYAYFMIQ